jgi:hypothetical protein
MCVQDIPKCQYVAKKGTKSLAVIFICQKLNYVFRYTDHNEMLSDLILLVF